MARGETAAYPEASALVAIQPRGSNRAAPSETRARILDTAARLYRRIGHKKTTVADIAHDMSMSSANVYRFFPSKQAIKAAVVGELLNKVIVAASAATREDGSATERLRSILQAVERQHAFHSLNDHRMHELVVAAIREKCSVAGSYADRLVFTVAQVIAEGQAHGEFSDADPVAIARCVLSASSAYLDPFVATVGTTFGRPTLDQMIEFCIAAFRAVPKESTTGPGPIQQSHRTRAL